MSGFLTSDGLGETENGYDVIYSVNKIIEVIRTGYSSAGFLLDSVTGSRYVETGLGGGKAYYRMRVEDAWVDLFILDTTTKTIALGSSINVAGSAPVKSVNKVTGDVLVNKIYTGTAPAVSPAVDTVVLEAYDGVGAHAAGVGALVDNLNATTASIATLPTRDGLIAYDTTKNRFVGHHNTGWKYLDGTDGEAVTYKDATGFTAAGRVALANGAASRVIKETGYTIPATLGTLGVKGAALVSDGTNVVFGVPQSVYAVTSGTSPSLDWAAASVFYQTISSDTTFSYTNSADGQTIMIVVQNVDTVNGWKIILPSSKWIMGQKIESIAPNSISIYTVVRIASVYCVVSTRDIK